MRNHLLSAAILLGMIGTGTAVRQQTMPAAAQTRAAAPMHGAGAGQPMAGMAFRQGKSHVFAQFEEARAIYRQRAAEAGASASSGNK